MRMIVENSGQFWIEKDKLTYLHGFFFWCRSKLQPEIVYESIMEWGLMLVLAAICRSSYQRIYKQHVFCEEMGTTDSTWAAAYVGNRP